MSLTQRRVDALRFNAQGPLQQIEYDGDLPAFGVRVYPNGRKSFVVRYRAQGRLRLYTLGAYGVLTVQEAKDRARHALLRVKDGGDPLAERQGERRSVTVDQFAAEYLELHAIPTKRSWKEDKRRLDTYVLPKWKQRSVASITRAEVVSFHATLAAKHRTEANRVWALLSVMFNKAIEWGRVPDDWRNPAHGAGTAIKRERSRERWVTASELPALLSAIQAEANPFHRAAFQLYLLTGLRRSELLSLLWKDVDLEGATLYVPLTKSGRSHTLPLSAAAKTLLEELPRELDNPHVFPANNRGHMTDLKKPWRRVRAAAGLNDVRLHDLRRTVGSMMAQDGASLLMVGKVLNHSESRTTERAYAHISSDVLRVAMERHATRIIDIGKRRRTA